MNPKKTINKQKNTRKKVLISAPYMQQDINKFTKFFKDKNIDIYLPKVRERLNEKELLEIIDQYDGVISGDDAFTEKVIDKAKNLKVISKWGTGIDSINKEYAERKGIKVCNTPNAFSEPVADTVLGFMLCFTRNIIATDKEMKKGKWKKIMGSTLDELTLGIIGLGDTGTAVARKASAFGVKIFGNDIKKKSKEKMKKIGVELATKNKIYKNCDIISLNCTLTKSSHHLITYEVMKKMKKNAIIINVSRGPVIKNSDLIKALKEKLIKGAALDVFEEEPLPKNSPLLKFNNVILSPHNANSSRKYWDLVHINTINNLLNVLNDKK